MKRFLLALLAAVTAVASFSACGKDDGKEGGGKGEEQNTETVEYYTGQIKGKFTGSNNITYDFADGKVTQVNDEGKETKGTFLIQEGDSDGDGENDAIALKITANGLMSTYFLSMEDGNVVLSEGSKKTILTKE